MGLQMTSKKNGPQTQMPSVKLDLPPYVIARPRADGTFRVKFFVPARLRPYGWPAERTLPFTGTRTGNLNDPDEVARIFADAQALYDQLMAARMGAEAGPKPFSIPALAHIWQDPDGFYWSKLAPRTRRFYEKVMAAHVYPWSAANGDRDIRGLDRVQVLAFLRLFQDRPHVQKHVRATLQQLMTVALDEGWIDMNPVAGIRLSNPTRTRITRWMKEDVDQHVDMALSIGWIGGARLILALWETCARVTDAMIWRRGEHYDPAGVFNYDTNKTDEEVADLPISARLRDLLNTPATLHLIVDPAELPYEAVRDDNRLGKDFRRLNDRVVAAGGRRLILRQLRHSAINDALDAGATPKSVQSVTAHASERTLNIYVRRSNKRATEVQRLRGIVS